MSKAHWVFGYGSLMWNPGFPYKRRLPAMLSGAHRALCIYSYHYRGTAERPGLVFGLDRGGACRGLAFEVAAADWEETVAYLRAREQISNAYVEALRRVRTEEGLMPALTYLVDRTHAQYAGRLSAAVRLQLVKQGIGLAGANAEYIRSTAEHLRLLGIRDRGVEALCAALAQAS